MIILIVHIVIFMLELNESEVKKKNMATAFTTRELKRGDVYYIQYDTDYLGGKMVGRPAIIVSNDRENQSAAQEISGVFLTTRPQQGTWNPKIVSTGRLSWACCDSLTRISRAKIGSYLGTLSEAEMTEVNRGVANHLELNGPEDDLEREKLRTEELEAKIADLESKLAEAKVTLEKKELDCKVHELAYDKVLDRLVEKQIEFDYLKKLAQAPVVAEEKPVVVEPEPEKPEPVIEESEKLVDINRCTERELMSLGFSFTVARNIASARPFMSVEDLRIVPGVTRVGFGIVEKKITVGDTSEYLPKKKAPVEPVVEEPVVEEKVNINTASAAELSMKLGIDRTVCFSITGTRKREGLYRSIEDVRNVKRMGPKQWEKIKDLICV